MRNDKIASGGQLTTTEPFNNKNKSFYLLLIPKSSSVPTVAKLKVELVDEKEEKPFPFFANVWNPILVNKVTLTSEDLSNYEVFYGGE